MDQDNATDAARLLSLENGQIGMRTQLDNISDAILALTGQLHSLSASAAPNPSVPPPPPSIPQNPPPTSALQRSRLKPAPPAEYDGTRGKGRAFFNSCSLYMKICPSEFADDSAKVNWVLSYMKSGRAASWADRVIRYDANYLTPRYPTWDLFAMAFRETFFPENEATDARMKLESSGYFQGRRSVEAYVDEFEDLIELSGYSDQLNTVVKFRRGLHPTIQDRIAEMGKDRPKDDDPDSWYAAARMFDQNRRANEAFHSSAVRRIPPNAPTSAGNPQTRPQPLGRTPWIPPSKPTFPPVTPARPLPPGIPMDIDAAKRTSKLPSGCYRCGEFGHRSRDCPTGFDIRLMSADDREELLEDLLALKDVAEEKPEISDGPEEVKGEDF